MLLRPYQTEAIAALYAYWRAGGGNPLVDMATGCGKSFVIAELIRRLYEGKPSRRFLLLTHVAELVEQDVAALRALWPHAPIGINSAGLGERCWDAPIVVAGIQSVFRNPEALGRRSLVIVDEAHLIPAAGDGMYRTLLDALRRSNPDMRVAGLSATCYRLDSGRLDEGEGRLFDRVVYTYGIAAGIADGWLAPLTARATPIEINVADVGRRGGEFIAGELEQAANRNEIVEGAADEIVARGAERKSWLCFCAGVDHAHHVRDALRRRGIVAETVTGETPQKDRDRIFAEFKAGNIRALTGANIFTVGFDAPAVDLIAMLRPTLSAGLFVQMVGRGTRKAEGKSDCEVLDFAANVRQHGPVDAVSITTRLRKGAAAVERSNAPRAKACPNCQVYAAVEATCCAACGYSWASALRAIKHAARAEAVPILSSHVVWLDVQAVTLSSYRKPDGAVPVLRVEYTCGRRVLREFIPLEHPGFARSRAEQWWRQMGGLAPPPATVFEALDRQAELDPVTAVAVAREGDWWRVTARSAA
jgi:DNA repair protein RadD